MASLSGVPHPRPQLQRASHLSLNGPWLFLDDPEGRWHAPGDVPWDDRTIVVPFAPETPASGIDDQRLRKACWYRRSVTVPASDGDDRMLLHFGAVDYEATVWIDGIQVGTHEGGYTPFSIDLTRFAGREVTLDVRAFDDPLDLHKPRGKQEWRAERHRFFYDNTTGIWQSVWLEQIPATSISSLHWRAGAGEDFVTVQARVAGPLQPGSVLRIHLSYDGEELAAADVPVKGASVDERVPLRADVLGRLGDRLLWSPEHPALVDATVSVVRPDGTVGDTVRSYLGRRTVEVREGRFFLNGQERYLRAGLHQGYWPESGLTPLDDAAIRGHIAMASAMGFDAVRLHQVVVDPRWLYWADRLGLMVFDEMPSAHEQQSADGDDFDFPLYKLHPDSARRLLPQWADVIQRDRSHPCIIAWVPFNESWGLPDLEGDPGQQAYLRAMAELTRSLDPTRLLIANDGWQSSGGDIVGVHHYHGQRDDMGMYDQENIASTLARSPYSKRVLTFDGALGSRAMMMTEFGGVLLVPPGSPDPGEGMPRPHWEHPWDTRWAGSRREFVDEVAARVRAIEESPLFSGFCYTQTLDQFQEVNGLADFHGYVKAPLEELRKAVMGRDYRPLPENGPISDVIAGDPALQERLGLRVEFREQTAPRLVAMSARPPASPPAPAPRRIAAAADSLRRRLGGYGRPATQS